MRKIIQYYSLIIALFLFSSVPTYTGGAPTRRKRPSTSKQNLKNQRSAPYEKVFTVVIVGVGSLGIGYLVISSLNKRFTKKEKKLISDAISEVKDEDINFQNIDTLLRMALNNEKIEIAKLLIKKGAKIHAKDENGDNALHRACWYSDSQAMVTWLLDECKIGIETRGCGRGTPFLFAVQRGKLDIAKLLRQRGASVDAKNHSGNNALHLACLYSGSVEMVTWLLGEDCGISIETKGNYERTPFLCAAEKGQLKIAKLLQTQGANIKKAGTDGDNALHLACAFSGSEAMVTWLLGKDCKIDIETKGNNKRTPFLSAAGAGKLAIVKLLKKQDADIKAEDKDGNNALHLACMHSESIAMVKWLLDKNGCNIDKESKGEYQITPFLCAAKKGDLGIAKELKKRGAKVDAEDGNEDNALHLACRYSGSEEMVAWLLDVCKIDKESEVSFGETPFLYAAQEGQLAIAKLLKNRGANIKAKNNYNDNALHYACFGSGSEAMVTWLLDVCKLDKESKGYYERTPFFWAAKGGQLEIAKLLRERGANIHAKDEDGDNALHRACRYSGSEEMVAWLLDVCKLDKESEGFFGKTPFLCAAEGGHLAIAKLLKNRHAGINAEDNLGNNALHLACRYSGSEEMVAWLLDECKIDKESKGEYQGTPFLLAAKGGQLEIAKLLRKRGANIDAKNWYLWNAVSLAKEDNNNESMINYLTNDLGLTASR